MSPPFRFNHLTGQRVRVPGPRFGEIVSVLYGNNRILEFKIRLDGTGKIERFLAGACYLILPNLYDIVD